MSDAVPHRAAGFTLIEVLVALVIVAVAVAAVLGALTTAANSAIYLRDKTFASWIALNRLTETRLALAAPLDGKSDGVLEYAGRRWQWQQEIAPSQIPGVKRIDVRVRALEQTRPGAAAPEISNTTSWTIQETGLRGAAVAAASPEQPIWEPMPKAPPSGTPVGASGT